MNDPELLEMLKIAHQYWGWMIELHPGDAGPTERNDFQMVKAAIAKATGSEAAHGK